MFVIRYPFDPFVMYYFNLIVSLSLSLFNLLGWSPIIRLGVIDCSESNSYKTCSGYGIRGYPSIRVSLRLPAKEIIIFIANPMDSLCLSPLCSNWKVHGSFMRLIEYLHLCALLFMVQ